MRGSVVTWCGVGISTDRLYKLVYKMESIVRAEGSVRHTTHALVSFTELRGREDTSDLQWSITHVVLSFSPELSPTY